MNAKEFQSLIASFDELSISQRRAAIEALQKENDSDEVLDVANDRARRITICPHCQSTDTWRWGSFNM